MNNNKDNWIIYHLEAIEYFQNKLNHKIIKAKNSELKDIQNWYINNGIEYHRLNAIKHYEKEPSWSKEILEIEEKFSKKINSPPITFIHNGKNRINYNLLKQSIIDFSKDIEKIRLNAMFEIDDSKKTEKTRLRRIAENKSLEEIFISANKINIDQEKNK